MARRAITGGGTMEALIRRLAELHRQGGESRRGQSYVEYVLIIALVSLAVTAALTTWSGRVSDALASLGSGL
jgi:Flp pilus assembly pilin Flp